MIRDPTLRYVMSEVPKSWEICSKCNFPHLGAVTTCPDRATRGQVRLMLDSITKEHYHIYAAYVRRLMRRWRELEEANDAQNTANKASKQ